MPSALFFSKIALGKSHLIIANDSFNVMLNFICRFVEEFCICIDQYIFFIPASLHRSLVVSMCRLS